MRDTPRWRRYLRFWRADLDADVDDEFRFHLDAEVERLTALGMTAEAARADARRRFGDLDYYRQYCRDADSRRTGRERRTENVTMLRQDLRYAFRSLRRQPTFTAIAALTLALGIGANTAIFSVVNGVLLTPLPYQEPERLVFLWETMQDNPQITVSYPDYLDWRQRTRSFEDIAIYNGFDQFTVTGRGDPERVRGGLASGNLFAVLGTRPALGRLFTPDDDRPGAAPVAVVSDGYWRLRLGGDDNVIGTSLMLDDVSYTVVGVLPPEIRLANRDVWIPIGLFVDSPRFVRSNHPGLFGIARLKAGVTVEQMRVDLGAVAKQLEADYPADNPGIGAGGAPMIEVLVGDSRRALVLLSGAVGLVLLIACANVANLVLSRSASREREFALRIAIGASRGHLVRQLLTESVVLSLAGGMLAVFLAWGGVRLLQALQPGGIPRLGEIRVDGTVMLYALGVSVLTGVLCGLLPAWHTARAGHLAALKDGGGGSVSSGRARARARAGLTVAEVALAVVLLAGAGLLLRSFGRLTRVDPGVDPDNLVAALVDLPAARYPGDTVRRQTFAAIVTGMAALPGVQHAAAATDLPVSTSWQSGVTFEGLAPVPVGSEPMLNGSIVSPEYFEAMSMGVIRGRGFSASDIEGTTPVAVISQSVARRFFGDRDPVGERIRQGRAAPSDDPAWRTIVGVVSDTRTDGLDALPRGIFYFPLAQTGARSMWVMVRSAAPVEQVTKSMRQALAAIDPALPLSNVTTMRSVLDGSVAQPRFSMLMLVICAGVAVVLAAVGIYGVISYNVSQRLAEIGVRVALGASRGDVLRLVIGQAMKITAVGLAIGLGFALATGRVIANQLYEVKPGDPLVLTGVIIFLALVALLAAALPALRATQVAPTIAIRGSTWS